MKEIYRTLRFLMAVILAMLMLYGCAPKAAPMFGGGYGCAVYTEQGCAKMVVASSGEIQVESGATLDLQSGATVDLAGTFSSSGGAVTISDNVLIDGAADAVQLTVQGYSTQTSNLFVAETSAGSDKFTIDNSGNIVAAGTSDLQGNISDSGGALTLVDNTLIDGAADAIQLTVQGYVTQTSSLLVLETSAGTDKLTVSNDGNTDIAGTLQYGANNLYPVGYASSGQELVYGTSSITGTATATHGLTTVTWAMAMIAETQDANTASCMCTVSTNVVTLYCYEDDGTTQSTEATVAVNWLVIGAP